jgi:hypothetical protein
MSEGKVIQFPRRQRDARAVALVALNLERACSYALLARSEVEVVQHALDQGQLVPIDPFALSDFEEKFRHLAANLELLRRRLLDEKENTKR